MKIHIISLFVCMAITTHVTAQFGHVKLPPYPEINIDTLEARIKQHNNNTMWKFFNTAIFDAYKQQIDSMFVQARLTVDIPQLGIYGGEFYRVVNVGYFLEANNIEIFIPYDYKEKYCKRPIVIRQKITDYFYYYEQYNIQNTMALLKKKYIFSDKWQLYLGNEYTYQYSYTVGEKPVMKNVTVTNTDKGYEKMDFREIFKTAKDAQLALQNAMIFKLSDNNMNYWIIFQESYKTIYVIDSNNRNVVAVCSYKKESYSNEPYYIYNKSCRDRMKQREKGWYNMQ